MRTALLIFEQVEPVPHQQNRFRIGETTLGIDGVRTRLTQRSFPSYEEASQWIIAQEKV
jgi:hypothetical protein